MTRAWTRSQVPVRVRVDARTKPLLQRLGPKPLSPRLGGRVEGIIGSVRQWAAETPGVAYTAIRPADSYERRAPRTLTPAGQSRLELLRPHRTPEAFRAVVPGARLIDCHAPLVLSSDRRLLLESGFEHIRAKPRHRRRLHRPQRLGNRYMALINQWWENHFHWFLDTLPRASLLPLTDEPDTPVIVPAGLSSAQLQSLAMVGIQRERLVAFEQAHLQVDELIFPSFAGQPGYPPRWAVSWLRDRLTPPRPSEQRRLWVSRASATRGRVANEAAVMKLLDGYGFELVQPERHALVEQLRMFGAADVIVAPHGSGLANILTARDATVIELQSERWWGKGCYYALADALDLDYWYLLCDTTRWGHLVVDVALLRATVDAALGARDDLTGAS